MRTLPGSYFGDTHRHTLPSPLLTKNTPSFGITANEVAPGAGLNAQRISLSMVRITRRPVLSIITERLPGALPMKKRGGRASVYPRARPLSSVRSGSLLNVVSSQELTTYPEPPICWTENYFSSGDSDRWLNNPGCSIWQTCLPVVRSTTSILILSWEF